MHPPLDGGVVTRHHFQSGWRLPFPLLVLPTAWLEVCHYAVVLKTSLHYGAGLPCAWEPLLHCITLLGRLLDLDTPCVEPAATVVASMRYFR